MNTEYFKNQTGNASELLKNGGLVAVPTETVYGLAGNGLDPEAVEKIYEVKGRPAVKPLSLMVPGPEAMELYCDPVPEKAKKLAKRFWPGPLTIVLKAKESVPEIVRAGGATVGLRCPDSALTLKLLKEAGIPFAAPSANPSGKPSPLTAREVKAYFDGKIDGIVDGGPCELGRESTLIAMDSQPYKILRKGAVSYETLADELVGMMTVIGVTGPSGCGKTSALETAGSLFPEGVCLTVDCDRLYHSLLETSEKLKTDIAAEFPEVAEIKETNGLRDIRIDRKKLGKIVFSNRSKLGMLNCITHKYIVDDVIRQMREHAMNGGQVVILDASELFGSAAETLCDATVAVLATLKFRLVRIMNRDGIHVDEAVRRVRAQHDDEYYKIRADFTVMNDGTREEFQNKIIKIVKEVVQNG